MCKLHEVYDSDITDHMDPFAIESTEDFADSIGNGQLKEHRQGRFQLLLRVVAWARR